jgi:type I restriction enzyme R subunit
MSALENFTEDRLEQAAIEIFKELGYDYVFAPDISCDGDYSERKDYRDVILKDGVKDALFRINRDLPEEALEDAYRQIITFNSPVLEENNCYFHRLLMEDAEVSYMEGGMARTKRAYIVDSEDNSNNEFLVANQFTIVENEGGRPDLVVFINGILLVVIELKSASDENVGIENAYNQIQTYKKDIPSLFNYNAFCVIYDGINAKAGTITSNEERFIWKQNWR